MTDRPSIEKEISDIKRSISQFDKDIKQLREWISANERGLSGMPETLRRITEDGLTRARADLGQRENEMARLRGSLAASERLLSLLTEIDRKGQEISALERKQEEIIVLLERHRAELRELQLSYDELTRPAAQVPLCEVVLPNNQRISLDAGRLEYVIGWKDTSVQFVPEIDLGPVGGSAQGVSRKHAILRFGAGQWRIEDAGSTNGTFVNESPVLPRQPVPLNDKSTIRVGNIKIFFRYATQTVRL